MTKEKVKTDEKCGKNSGSLRCTELTRGASGATQTEFCAVASLTLFSFHIFRRSIKQKGSYRNIKTPTTFEVPVFCLIEAEACTMVLSFRRIVRFLHPVMFAGLCVGIYGIDGIQSKYNRHYVIIPK